MNNQRSKIWIKPVINELGKASDLIRGSGENTDPKSTQQPDDNVFEGFAAGTELNPG